MKQKHGRPFTPQLTDKWLHQLTVFRESVYNLFDVQLTQRFEISLVITIPRNSSVRDTKQGVGYSQAMTQPLPDPALHIRACFQRFQSVKLLSKQTDADSSGVKTRPGQVEDMTSLR